MSALSFFSIVLKRALNRMRNLKVTQITLLSPGNGNASDLVVSNEMRSWISTQRNY